MWSDTEWFGLGLKKNTHGGSEVFPFIILNVLIRGRHTHTHTHQAVTHQECLKEQNCFDSSLYSWKTINWSQTDITDFLIFLLHHQSYHQYVGGSGIGALQDLSGFDWPSWWQLPSPHASTVKNRKWCQYTGTQSDCDRACSLAGECCHVEALSLGMKTHRYAFVFGRWWNNAPHWKPHQLVSTYTAACRGGQPISFVALWSAKPIIRQGFAILALHETDYGFGVSLVVSVWWTGSSVKTAGACWLTWQRSANWKVPDTSLTSWLSQTTPDSERL